LGIPEAARVLALFPGSRRQEIARLWVPFREAARRLRDQGRCDRVVVATIPGMEYPGNEGFELRQVQSGLVLSVADAAIVKSGTATLEAALAGVPMVVAYRLHPVTAWLARRLIRVSWVSLVNLIAGKAVVPELLQGEVTPARLAQAVAALLDRGSPAVVAQREGFTLVRERLGRPGAAARVAELAEELMGSGESG
jgi:lipid-A-disaccharide synthase